MINAKSIHNLKLHCLNFTKSNVNSYRKLIDNLVTDRIISTAYPENNDFISPVLIYTNSLCIDESFFHKLNQIISGGKDRIMIIIHNAEESKVKILAGQINDGIADTIFYNDNDECIAKINNRINRWDEIDSVIFSDKLSEYIIGESKNWLKFLADVTEAALFSQASILVTGDTGTGKELIAGYIHSIFKENDCPGDLVIVDCTTLPKDLAGSELFGHEKGAYTSASYFRDGAIANANNGTLFLDEIGELPVELQNLFLRVIQEGKYKRIGSNVWRNSEFNLITATNKNLEQEVKKGNFREDLYYRISGNVFKAPSLNERREDIPLLINHFLRKNLFYCEFPGFDDDSTEYLIEREYPGNVRELEQLVKRIAYKYTGPGPVNLYNVLSSENSNSPFPSSGNYQVSYESKIRNALNEGTGLREIKNMAANTAIEIALKNSNGIVKEAAKILGITERAIQIRKSGNSSKEL